MIVNIPWLKEYLGELNWNAEELADKLTSIGHEAEVINDQTVEAEITPNRGDCLSVLGLARDLAGVYGLKLSVPNFEELPPSGQIIDVKLAENLKDKVPFDLLVEITDYQDQSSPAELQAKLKVLGQSSKNLIIDLTNVVAYEFGAPLHVFDFEKVASGLEIALSHAEEEITLLDGKKIELPEGCLVQRTKGRAVDLAGVMGGLDSAVDAQTNHFILQAAVIDPSLVRTTSKKSGVATSASAQYQKGVSSYAADLAVKAFLSLLKKYQPTVSLKQCQILGQASTAIKLEADLDKVSKLIGYSFTDTDLKALEALGFTCEVSTVTSPLWRTDITTVPELAEELARVVGLNKISPVPLEAQPSSVDSDFRRLQTLKEQLVAIGLTESLGYSFVSAGEVEIANPFNKAESFMRTSLQDSLLQTVSCNPYMKRVCYFEVGHIFSANHEQAVLGIITPSLDESIKKQLETLCGQELSFEKLSAEQLSRYDIKFNQLVFAQTELQPILAHVKPSEHYSTQLRQYEPISKFPPITRDLSFLVSKSVESAKIATLLGDTSEILFVEQSDSYESEKLGANNISLTFRIIMQDMNGSMTDAQADEIIKKCLNRLSKEVQFTLR